MATNSTTITTAEQLWAAGLEQPSELLRGELILMSPAGGMHGRYAGRLYRSLSNHVFENGLGEVLAAETGFILERNPDTVRAPDLAFISTQQVAANGLPEKFVPYAPDLVAEVVSPSDRPAYVEQKVQQWLAFGCQMVLVVEPKLQQVRQYAADGSQLTLSLSDTLSGGDVVPGWRLPLSQLFSN